MKDLRETILKELEVLRKKEYQDKQVFKGNAYSKVIAQIRDLEHPVQDMEDLKDIKGVGEGIRKKLEEIILTGKLKAASIVRHERPIEQTDALMKIYGIGPVKAKELIDMGIRSYDDLRGKLEKTPSILNEKQKIGLKYIEDLNTRIPRTEMLKHEQKIRDLVSTVSSDFTIDIVGSFRRGAEDSGDIDVLLSLPPKYSDTTMVKMFKDVCNKMIEDKYITDVLALGNKKCMGVCKIDDANGKARRLDLLLTPVEEYPYALLYFTGSDRFNVAMRKHALVKGYTLNEHGMKPVRENVPKVPEMKTEKDIFRFLDYKYVAPEYRNNKKNL